ncbi:MAG: hypothetical protein AAF352_07400, partial [Pseudomonadota bacterium]
MIVDDATWNLGMDIIFDVKNLRITNPQAPDTPMLVVGSIAAKLSLLDLLRPNNFRAEYLVLADVDANLQTIQALEILQRQSIEAYELLGILGVVTVTKSAVISNMHIAITDKSQQDHHLEIVTLSHGVTHEDQTTLFVQGRYDGHPLKIQGVAARNGRGILGMGALELDATLEDMHAHIVGDLTNREEGASVTITAPHLRTLAHMVDLPTPAASLGPLMAQAKLVGHDRQHVSVSGFRMEIGNEEGILGFIGEAEWLRGNLEFSGDVSVQIADLQQFTANQAGFVQTPLRLQTSLNGTWPGEVVANPFGMTLGDHDLAG